MRLRVATMAGAISLALGQPIAALGGNTGHFVAGTTVIFVTAAYCDEFEFVEHGIARAADRNGVDRSIMRGTVNALLAQMDGPYDPKYLIPEITALVRDTMVGVKRTFAWDKNAAGKEYGDIAVESGILRRRDGGR